ncbi:hypothetical protein [Mycolicibacterium mucogenicum]|uniref:Phage head morphogenesis domain-containing protein n=1 Tax=Mycolicibacterium mucogenicum TaxID=56689 RepID=A0A4R5WCP7_MYCMU|nr:hypothetical protein [Mycolicibacterium mucogenicum]TDK86275.1 hypothetical protein EUA03_19975 [Mycolicibacterium mucogenicum]
MIAVEQYQAATEQLASQTEQAALVLYGQYRAGQLDQADTALLLAALINRANATAVSLADVWLSIQIEYLTGDPVPTVGVLPVDGSERLVKAVNTILSEPTSYSRQKDIAAGQDLNSDSPANVTDASKAQAPNAKPVEAAPDTGPTEPSSTEPPQPDPQETQVARLARCEPLEAAQQASHDAMQQQPLVEGWIRHMDADPCQLCVWWWREGRVWPKAHPMPRHKGCNCQPKVVLRQEIQSTGYTRRLRGVTNDE